MTDIRKGHFHLGRLTIYPPPSRTHCHVDNSYNFSDCQLYQVTLPSDPPSIILHTVAM